MFRISKASISIRDYARRESWEALPYRESIFQCPPLQLAEKLPSSVTLRDWVLLSLRSLTRLLRCLFISIGVILWLEKLLPAMKRLTKSSAQWPEPIWALDILGRTRAHSRSDRFDYNDSGLQLFQNWWGLISE